MIEHKDPAQRAVDYIVEAIRRDYWPAGSLLYSDREMSELIGVTRTSYRQAIAILRERGVVRVEKGKLPKVMPTMIKDDSEMHF